MVSRKRLKPLFGALLLLAALAVLLGAAVPKTQPSAPPSIRSILKPSVYEKLNDDREVMVHADLADLKLNVDDAEPEQRYSFYGAMTVRASLAQTRRVLLDFPLYAQMVPYVEKVDYEPRRRELTLKGGIWKFWLHSRIKFEEPGERQLKYRIIGGHFTGLSGELLFEERGPLRTLVYFNGELKGKGWPPRFVIERGAEIVFGFTGRRMRNYIESKNGLQDQRNQDGIPQRTQSTQSTQGESDDNEIPQPRSGTRSERGKSFR
ncbi:MAG: hypothetical protein A2X94_15740 [Bdellovibrionales bacterium GWB1_55_8]|nr:MAG: hypothetical protein A2X94_15740 [Bdellovibrionales bacterium GWB1_55_8]